MPEIDRAMALLAFDMVTDEPVLDAQDSPDLGDADTEVTQADDRTDEDEGSE